MTQAPENIMHGNCGHFVCQEFEPYFLPMSLMPVQDWLKNKAFRKIPQHIEQCKTKDGDKTLSSVNFLLLTAPCVEISLFQGCKFYLCFFLIFSNPTFKVVVFAPKCQNMSLPDSFTKSQKQIDCVFCVLIFVIFKKFKQT